MSTLSEGFSHEIDWLGKFALSSLFSFNVAFTINEWVWITMIVFKPKLTSLINGTGRMGSKLMEKTFTLNTALSLWWVQCGEKIAGSILSEVYSPKVTMPHMITKLRVLLNNP